MSPQVMWPEPNPNLVACLFDHCPCRLITYWKDPLIGLNPIVPDVFLDSVGHFLWDEYMLPLFAAFGVSERQFPLIDVHGSQFQDLSHSHSTPGHQFQDEPVSGFDRCEDDFID